MLELVPEVSIHLFSDWSTPADRPIRLVEFFVSRHFEFQLPEQVPTDVVPRGNFSGSEKRATEYYSWVPEDVYGLNNVKEIFY